MKSLRSVWVVLFAVFMSMVSLAAPVEQVAVEATLPPIARESDPAIALAHRVENLKKAFLSGKESSIRLAVQEVELTRRTYGTTDVTPLVEAMALWARQRGEEGNPELGLQVVQTLERWAPREPILLGTRVILLRQQGFKGYFTGIPEVLDLTRIRLASPLHRGLWIMQHVAWLRMMAAILLWGWALGLGLRYRNVLRYLWETPLFRKLPAVPVAIVGALILTFPVILTLDPSVAAMVWLWLLAPFMYRSEVRVTLLVILLQLVHPALALLEPQGAIIPPPSLTSLQLQPHIKPLEQLGAQALPMPDRDFLKGWRQLQAQDWAGAETTFDTLAASHPDKAAVLNNRGVARYQQKKLDLAKQDFDQAAALALGNPNPEILLNQSVMAFNMLDSTTGAAKEEEARLLAPDTVTALMNANQSRNELRTFPTPLPETPERLAALRREQSPPTLSLQEQVKSPRILFNLLLPLLGVIAFLIRLSRSVKQSHPTQCTRCGEPFHTTDSPDVEVCSKCHHLFLLKDGLHGESRKKKVQDVASFQKSQGWIHRALVVFFPGLDLCFLGEAAEGFMEFGALAFAMGIVLATGRSVRFPGEILADPASVWQILGLILLAILFLRSWVKLIPRRS